MKIIRRENLSWESQKELRKFQNLYPHINPHRDYSQNYHDVLSNLQRSASPYLIQRLQTIEKESSPKRHGSDIHFCWTNTTKTIAVFQFLGIMWVDWVQLDSFLLHVVSHLGLPSAGGSVRLVHLRELTPRDEHGFWLLLGAQLRWLTGAPWFPCRSLHV